MKKTFKVYRWVTIISFLSLLVLPLFLTGNYMITGQRMDSILNGYQDIVEKPVLSVGDWHNGNFQTEYTAWFEAEFCPRSFLVKIYNQIRYTCFNLAPGNLVVGGDNVLFEKMYIDELNMRGEYDFTALDNYNSMVEFVNELEEVSLKLCQFDKQSCCCFCTIESS